MPSSPTHKNLGSLVEQPDSRSRTWTKAGLTETRVYIAEYDVCVAAQKAPNTLGTGDLAGFIVQSSNVDSIRGEVGKLTDVWVVGGDDADPETNPLPPDEVSVSATNQSPRIERHAIFRPLDSLDIGGASVMSVIDDALRAPSSNERNIQKGRINASSLTSGQKALALRCIQLLEGGTEAFYLATLRYSWSTHYYDCPNTTRGGYNDTISGPLSSYFVGTIDWLREADDLQFQNGIWRLTRSWLGGDTGSWPSDIYPTY